MAEQPFIVYDHALDRLMNGAIDLDTHTFKVMYLRSTYTPNTASDSTVISIRTAELSASNGTNLRQTLTSVTWARTTSSGVAIARFDANDSTVSTSSTIKVRYVAIYDDNGADDTSKHLVCFSQLTTTGSGVQVTQLTLQWSAQGIFKLKRG